MTNPYLQDILKELQYVEGLISTEDNERLTQAILSANRVFVAGAGRSGFMMRSFAMRLMHLGLKTYVVGETVTPNIAEGDLLIIGSGSGNTGSLVNMAQKAKQFKASVALISIFKDSSIGKLSDIVIEIPASTPKSERETAFISKQPMGSLFEQCLLLYLDSLIMDGMLKKSMDAAEMFAKHANLE